MPVQVALWEAHRGPRSVLTGSTSCPTGPSMSPCYTMLPAMYACAAAHHMAQRHSHVHEATSSIGRPRESSHWGHQATADRERNPPLTASGGRDRGHKPAGHLGVARHGAGVGHRHRVGRSGHRSGRCRCCHRPPSRGVVWLALVARALLTAEL